MKIALVQQSAGDDLDDNLKKGLTAMDEAASNGAELVAYAELAFEPFYPRRHSDGNHLTLAQTIPGKFTDKFCEKAKELGVVVVLNLFEKDGNSTYDSSPVIDSDGAILGVTRMMHITDYANFHEQDYYTPSSDIPPVYDTSVGKIGVAICYDRHYPEVMRSLRLQGAELVVIPQAGTVGEWPDGLYQAEVQVASFQNGYYAALVNRLGIEGNLHFAGESFVTAPDGKVISSAPSGEEAIIYADLDFSRLSESHASRYFLKDRRPGSYSSIS
ncbi:MAG: carbon-nitrogen hydrolase family protein [Candidatus Marinimicrobia bacterium]|nr:carbon-nitrogen hydrolase family protein [Candidatus Neomarinimicrobiota bacterium]